MADDLIKTYCRGNCGAFTYETLEITSDGYWCVHCSGLIEHEKGAHERRVTKAKEEIEDYGNGVISMLEVEAEKYLLFAQKGIPFQSIILTAMKEACAIGMNARRVAEGKDAVQKGVKH